MVAKLVLLLLFVFFVILIFFINNRSMSAKSFTYLALGDSYTIGEHVALYESFPYQTVQLLRKAGHNFNAPEIIARTGWTTDDLKKGIRNTIFQTSYDVVSLLIGVNDQYSKKDLREYVTNFELLLKQAISFAADKATHVFVLSVPDWSGTPYAEKENRPGVTEEINAFNAENKKIALRYKVHYIPVTQSLAEIHLDPTWLASDLLHPSGKEYGQWSLLLAGEIQKLLA